MTQVMHGSSHCVVQKLVDVVHASCAKSALVTTRKESHRSQLHVTLSSLEIKKNNRCFFVVLRHQNRPLHCGIVWFFGKGRNEGRNPK